MSAEPVNFTLYFESLCPDCQRFFIKQLYHTYMALGEDVMNLTLVPYGNARVSKYTYSISSNKQQPCGITVMCLSIGTPKNSKFSICSKWKNYYF